MSNRAQCVLGLLTGAAIDLSLYAGVIAAGLAALTASGAFLWWRSR